MYSWEIDNEIKRFNYVLPASVYINICNTSPQIDHIKFDKDHGEFSMWTNDTDKPYA